MEKLFNVINVDENDRIGNLKSEAHSVVRSTKYFPIYNIGGKKMIFKPLSKTKPLTTPLFSYSEVYWSYIINKYFDPTAPRYYLATSSVIEKEQQKYYSQGVLVESLTPNDERLINLYDYFMENPDSSFDIKDYENYCMMNYDYTIILESNFIKNNKEIGEGLAYQILLSMLRQDQNFHYENVNFILNGGTLSLAPPIDFEFSTPFLYPDIRRLNLFEREKYIESLKIADDNDEIDTINYFLKSIGMQPISTASNKLRCNLCTIIKNYPEVVVEFTKQLDSLIIDLPDIKINDPDHYIGKLNSDYWEVWHAFFKENDLNKSEELKNMYPLQEINKDEVFGRISSDILSYSIELNMLLKTYLMAYYSGIEDIENMTMRDFYSKLSVANDEEIKDIDLVNKKLKLKKKETK
ncbi:MAG: hypothetical protein IJO43_00940 [Bacilli bacterium]|nr:hypothetical protein [Bacilli bacterium]